MLITLSSVAPLVSTSAPFAKMAGGGYRNTTQFKTKVDDHPVTVTESYIDKRFDDNDKHVGWYITVTYKDPRLLREEDFYETFTSKKAAIDWHNKLASGKLFL